MSQVLHTGGVTSDYVYMPKGHYTVRGMEVTASSELERSLSVSNRFQLVFKNPDTMIFAYEDIHSRTGVVASLELQATSAISHTKGKHTGCIGLILNPSKAAISVCAPEHRTE